MAGAKKRTICTWAVAAVLVFAAVVCRFLDMLYLHSDVMGLTRSAIYIFLFSAWAVSVRNRIIHVRIRRYLTAVAAFMVFWFLIRTVKFHFPLELLSPHLPRYLWYLYYLPMLFIPMLGVLVAVSPGRPEEAPQPGWTAWFSAFTALLVLLGDMTAVFCLMYAATLELCIHCSLIPSNTHYREMFDASTVGVQITDENSRVFLSSAAARPVPEGLRKQAQTGPVMLGKGVRLCAAPIRGGYVFWQEDVSELLSVLAQLGKAKQEFYRPRSIEN